MSPYCSFLKLRKIRLHYYRIMFIEPFLLTTCQLCIFFRLCISATCLVSFSFVTSALASSIAFSVLFTNDPFGSGKLAESKTVLPHLYLKYFKSPAIIIQCTFAIHNKQSYASMYSYLCKIIIWWVKLWCSIH